MSLLYAMLADTAAKYPDHPAIMEEETVWSYREFQDKVNRLASAIAAQGINPKDRVGLMFMNQKEFMLGFFAILRLGAVAVPINLQLPPEDILYVIMDSGARLMLTTAQFAPRFDGTPLPVLVTNQEGDAGYPSFEQAIEAGDPNFRPVLEREPRSLSVLVYTSGTTGKPKGVMLSEENKLGNLDGIEPAFPFSPEDRVLLVLPLFHAYGLIIGLYAMRVGATLVLVPNFAPKKILSALVERRASVLPLVPTMFGVLLQAVEKMGSAAFQSLRFAISGGASLPPALLKRVEESLSITVLEGYGLSETSPVLTVNRLERGSIPGSVGKPLHNVQLQLVDDNRNLIEWEPGQQSAEGEIRAKGPNVMMGYYNLPGETNLVLDTDGWFYTGDLGHFDAEGNLVISGGRKKDLIIKAGENIAPVKIEEVLYQHPAVQEASVIGIPDEKTGEEILACIELREGASATEAEIKQFCRERLPAFIVPAAVKFYPELPKNASGKVLKKILRIQIQSTTPV